MKIIIKRSFLCVFIAGMYSISVACVAQTGGNEEKSLQGKWIFESITAFEGTVEQPFGLDDFYCDIPSEINIRQDDVIVVRKERTDTFPLDAVVRGNVICFCFCASWKLTDNKLQLEWTQDIETEGADPKLYNMILTYKLN